MSQIVGKRSLKRGLKATARIAALMVAAPAALLYWTGRALAGAGRVFPGFSQAFSLLPGLSGVYLRGAFYAWILPHYGRDACLSFGTVLSHPGARIGRNAFVGLYCVLGDVTLEDDVLLGSNVTVMNGNRQHGIDRLDIPVREQPGIWPRVTVGCDTWVGDRSILMADVGRHCVIGAGSVVTKPVPDFSIAVGVPARIVGYRSNGADPAGVECRISEAAHPPAFADDRP